MVPDGIVDRLVAAIRTVPRPVVLVDGRSGSGKTTLAARLAPALDATLVHLEDIYPGWDGLDRAVVHLQEHVLGAANPRWRSWDWEHDQPAEWHDVDSTVPLVVEGVGALSRSASALATFGIWVELDDDLRRRRALDRDGDLYAPHWDRWAAQEAAFIAAERPIESADAVVRADSWAVDFTRRHIPPADTQRD